MQTPCENGNEKKRKPTGPDIGNEHGSVIKARFREVGHLAVGAFFMHVQGTFEGESRGVKKVTLTAVRAFHPQHSAQLGAVFSRAHLIERSFKMNT